MKQNASWMCLALMAACAQPSVGSEALERTRFDGAPIAPIEYYLTSDTMLWLTPSIDKEVSNPFGPGMTANWVASLMRGQRVLALAKKPGWLQIQMENDAEGWIQEHVTFPSSSAIFATLLGDTEAMAEPGAVAPVTMLKAGDIILVQHSEGDSTYVEYGEGQSAWVPSGLVTMDSDEIEVAKLMQKSFWLNERGVEPISKLFDKARDKFPSARLIDEFANYVSFENFNVVPEPITAH
jgi:hypothetical protein